MKQIYLMTVLMIVLASTVSGQVGINADNSLPNSSAMLDVKSTDKGFLPPRMTTEQMNSIAAPCQGLIVYNISVNSLFWFNGSNWRQFNEPYMESDPVFTAHPAFGISIANLSNWNSAYTNRITAASGTAPLSLSISNNQLLGSITAANSSTSGYLTSADWNLFNNKQNALTLGNVTSGDLSIIGGNGAVIGNGMNLSVNKGNLTEVTSSVLTISGGTNAVLGSGSSIQVKPASTSQSGYLSSGDWNIFNNKVSSQWVSTGLNISYNSGKVGIGTSTPVSSAALEIKSTNSGVLMPRMTFEQRNGISNPMEGLMVFCTNCGSDGTGLVSIFQGGNWKTIDLNCNAPVTPAAGSHSPSVTQIIWHWNTVPIALGYKWNTVNDYNTAIDLGTSTSMTESALTCWTNYTRYVWAYNACGPSSELILTSSTLQVPFATAPTEGVHVPSIGQIVWNWNAVSDATGYKWNTINDYNSAMDMGPITTKTEIGLDPGTTYTRFVWAYNTCGASSATTLTSQTPLGFSIGQSYGGGKIFYIDGTGNHGLIASTVDQSTAAAWGCQGTSIPGTSYAIGTGQANTTLIINGCSTAGIAARLCNDLIENGYDDWFLPSVNELHQMLMNYAIIGGFSSGSFYWSSSENSGNPTEYARLEYYNAGGITDGAKNSTYAVRAIRAF